MVYDYTRRMNEIEESSRYEFEVNLERERPDFIPCDTWGKKCGHDWNSHIEHEYGGDYFYMCGLCDCSPSKLEVRGLDLNTINRRIGDQIPISTCKSCFASFEGVMEKDIAQGIHKTSKCPVCERAKGWTIDLVYREDYR